METVSSAESEKTFLFFIFPTSFTNCRRTSHNNVLVTGRCVHSCKVAWQGLPPRLLGGGDGNNCGMDRPDCFAAGSELTNWAIQLQFQKEFGVDKTRGFIFFPIAFFTFEWVISANRDQGLWEKLMNLLREHSFQKSAFSDDTDTDWRTSWLRPSKARAFTRLENCSEMAVMLPCIWSSTHLHASVFSPPRAPIPVPTPEPQAYGVECRRQGQQYTLRGTKWSGPPGSVCPVLASLLATMYRHPACSKTQVWDVAFVMSVSQSRKGKAFQRQNESKCSWILILSTLANICNGGFIYWISKINSI